MRSGVHIWQPHDIQHLFSLSEQWATKNRRPIVVFADQFDNWLGIHSNVAAQLEIELDGFSGRREGVYFIATAQQEPREFGGSMFRSGRIETEVAFSDPDRRQQIELLEGFLHRYPHDPDIDIGNLIHLLDVPTPADLKAFVDDAFVCALQEVAVAKVKKEKGWASKEAKVTENLLIDVFLPQVLDPKTGHTMSPEEERGVAIHEMGHVVVARALGVPAHSVSCRPGLESLGLMYQGDSGLERKNPFVEERYAMICIGLGSIEAETLLDVPPNIGCNADLHNAADMAQRLIATGVDPQSPLVPKYGRLHFHPGGDVDDEGKVGPPQISEELKGDLEKAVVLVLRERQAMARNIVAFFGKELIGMLADALIAKPNKVMLQKELDRLLEPKLSEFRSKHNIVEIQ
ncbi:MAG: hypothetical protein HY434_01990 [Candidatus Liptonbacteria bacterium]|nr:hypothetical protein [Candidatus Liptonbacteria bacterium]